MLGFGKKRISLLFWVCSALAVAAPIRAYGLDLYRSFQELLLAEGPESFRITLNQGRSPLLILAPHAGSIEVGTSELARLIAGEHHSLYLFEGSVTHPDPMRLHLTSHRFNEPIAVQATRESALAISVHAMKDRDDLPELCIGGGFPGRGDFIARLRLLRPAYSFGTCQRFRGTHPNNIVNQSRSAGIQLEFSSRLVERVLQSPKLIESLKALIDGLDCVSLLTER